MSLSTKAVTFVFALTAAPMILVNSGFASAPPRPAGPVAFVNAAADFCLARIYDDAHMTSNPRQKVTRIALSYQPHKSFPDEPAPLPMWDEYGAVPGFSARLIVTLKGDNEPYLAPVMCREAGPKVLDCGVEGDGGSFTLEAAPDGKAMLRLPEALAVERLTPGAASDPDLAGGTLIEAKDDQKAFLLAPDTSEFCKTDWPPLPPSPR